jgi:ketosteroid isomerase-like protein
MVALAFGQEGSAVQKEVWKGEEAYWRLLKEKNVEAYMSLWHEQFVGWPTGTPTPADKAAIRTRWYPSLTIENSIISYDLKPMSIRVHGDTAVVYSSVKLTTRNKQSNEREETFFLTHTWMKENAKWQIVGGMARRPGDDDKP